jgi:hypothetical protein
VTDRERAEEEEVVHSLTFDILKKSALAQLDYVLDSYRGHRICQFGSDMREEKGNADLRI